MPKPRLAMALLLTLPSADFCSGQDMTAPIMTQAPTGPGGGGLAVGANLGQGMGYQQGPGFGLSQQQLGFKPVIPGVYTPQTAAPSQQQPGLQAPVVQQGLGLPSTLPQSGRAASFQPQTYVEPQTAPGRTLPAAAQPSARTDAARIPADGGGAASMSMARGGPGRIGGPALDPRVQGGEQAAKGGALGAMKDIDKARGQQLKGGADPGLPGKLDSLFDFSKSRNGGMLESMGKGPSGMNEMTEASAFPDPKVLGTDQALAKMRGLAGAAAETDAPFLYQHAVGMAREQLPEAKAEATISRILRDAWKRGPDALRTVGQGAMDAAVQGRTTEALHFTKAVHGWNDLLASKKGPFLVNLPEFRDAVKHVLAQALKTKGGASPSGSPKVAFQAVESGERARMKALVSLPQGMASQVLAVPAKLAETLALDQAIVDWETQAALETPGLSAAFALTPQAGFRDFYRARRAVGDSVLRSFWLASRQFMSASSAGLWQRFKDLVFAVLRFFGIVSGSAPGTVVEASPDALKSVRASPGQRLVLPSLSGPAEKDALGLGYRLHRVAP